MNRLTLRVPTKGNTSASVLRMHHNEGVCPPPTTRSSWWETKPVFEGVEAYKKRSLHSMPCLSGVPTSIYKSNSSKQVPMGNKIPPPRMQAGSGNATTDTPNAAEEPNFGGATRLVKN